MVNSSTHMKKTDIYLSHQIIQHKKTKTSAAGIIDPFVEPALKSGGVMIYDLISA